MFVILKHMKILVTGHKGFLGGAFIKEYSNQYDIVGYDLIEGDELMDFQNLVSKIKGCEMVVHLAAIPKPIEGKSFEDYFTNNVRATQNVAKAAAQNKVKRIVYASSTSIYGIEKGIPFATPIVESQPFVSQYLSASQLSCREVDLSYHVSKVQAEQIMAWYGLNKIVETAALRFGPINKVFLGTSVSLSNAAQAIQKSLDYSGQLWYEPFSIVDDVPHIDTSKAKRILGYTPKQPRYTEAQLHSAFDERTK